MRDSIFKYTLFFIILLGASNSLLSGQEILVKKIETNQYAHSNIAPIVSDSTLIFSSNKKLSTFRNYFNSDGDYIYRLYSAKLDNNTLKGKCVPFLESEAGRFNIGSLTVSADGKFMIVCQNGTDEIKNSNGKRGNTYALYFSEKNLSGKWSRLKPLPINTKKIYNAVHPSLSANGNLLAFASDAPDGIGKFDIYISEKVNGLWQEPKNLGRNINTEEDELYPSFAGNTKLYFSTNGRFGFGGMDIYVSELKNIWNIPKILEEPINSTSNDFSCFVYEDERSGYFSSDRTTNDEIYFFEQLFPKFDIAEPQVIDTFCFSFAETSQDSTQQLTYIWNFGDGGTAKGLEADHCFVGPGLYKVFLNVVDPITKQELYSVANYDLPLDYTQQVFINCPDTVKIGQEVQFDAKNSKLGSLVPKDYFWVIDNKDKRVGEQVFYTFTKKGVFTILCGVVSRENPNERMASTRLIVVE